MPSKKIYPKARAEVLAVQPYAADLPDLAIWELKEKLGLSHIVKLSLNENPRGPSPKAMKAMEAALQSTNRYPDFEGSVLRQQICKYLDVEIEQVTLSNGADELIFLIAHTFLKPGDEALIPFPTFGNYFWASQLAGANIKTVPLVDFSINLHEVLKAASPLTKVIFLCNPNNPTGTAVSKRDLAGFLNELRKDILVAIDEAYIDYVTSPQDTSAVDLLRQHQNIIILRTFSKIYGLASVRVGYGVSSPEIINAINRYRLPFNVNYPGQLGAAASLQDEEYWLESRQLNELGKKYLEEQILKLGLTFVPSQTNFLLINTCINSRLLLNEMAKKGVIVRPGNAYRLDTFIRVSIGTMEDNMSFISVLQESLSRLS